MPLSPNICGVILSAGFSSRMGRDKALLPWPPMIFGQMLDEDELPIKTEYES